ncbi:MAG: VOC family protein [Bacteroidota bacterium]
MMTSLKKTLLYFRIMVIVVFMLTHLFFPCEAKNSHQPNDSTSAKTGNPIRFEHIAFNVPDPVATVQWYTTNLGMKIMRFDGAPTFTTFIADSGMHMMIEFFHNAGYPLLEPAKMHNMAIHLAFSTPSIVKTQEMLVAAGATIVDSLRKTASGDQVMTLRDPWGLPIQFVERIKPMLSFTGLYIEHFAMNISDSRAKAKWYGENLHSVIVRDGKAPTYGMFIADAGKNMMFELYQQQEYPVIDFTTISHMSIHIAFMVNDIQAAKSTLVAAGAKVVDDIMKTASGDFVMMLRDPWGLPIQFVKRENAILK